MTESMTVRDAARRLGVKPATLYAYVSRGVLTSSPGPDGRSSLLDRAEVEALAVRGRPRRASRETGLDIEIATAITSIDNDVVRFRGQDQSALASTHTFEEVAEFLWTGELTTGWRWPAATGRTRRSGTVLARLVTAAAGVPRAEGRSPHDTAASGRVLIPALVAALGPHGGSVPRLRLPGRAPIVGTVAGRLWAALAPGRPPSGAVRAMNAALVLLADHELAASTLAVRVAASARADPAAAVVAGLSTVSAPLHGGASRHCLRVLRRAAETNSDRALDEAWAALGLLPGFGHRVYRAGDPRCVVLLQTVREAWPRDKRWVHIDAVVTAGRRRGEAPNIDLALAALTWLAGMGDDAGEAIFAVARTAGWLAHAAEEYQEAPLRFRPRADYIGPC